MEVTDVSKAVEVPVGPDTTTLTVLVVNGSVADDQATVTFGRNFPRFSLGNSAYTLLCAAADGCPGEWCGIKPNEDGPKWNGPLAWTGNAFVFEYDPATKHVLVTKASR